MKTFLKHTILLVSIILTSCTDVIDVDVPTAAPRLVIEASLDWEKGTIGNNQTIKLSTSTPYFNSQGNSSVTGASVMVTKDDDGTEFVFVDQNNGNYTIDSFIPEINQSYTLEVIYNGETYTAHETLTPVVDIEDVYQSYDRGFPEVLEVNIDFFDPENEDNYYLFKIQEQTVLLPTLFNLDDEFINGNLVNVFIERNEDEDINQEEYEAGDVLDIEFYGVSEQYYNYISLLITQYESGFNPFGTTPVQLKGNCVNLLNTDDYAFGYFRLTQVVKTSYTFE